MIIMLSMLPYWGVKEMESSYLLSVLLSYSPDLPSGDENGLHYSRDSLPSVYCCSVVPVSCPRATVSSCRSCRRWSPVMILLAFRSTCRSCPFQSSPSSRSCRLPPPVYWGGCSRLQSSSQSISCSLTVRQPCSPPTVLSEVRPRLGRLSLGDCGLRSSRSSVFQLLRTLLRCRG